MLNGRRPLLVTYDPQKLKHMHLYLLMRVCWEWGSSWPSGLSGSATGWKKKKKKESLINFSLNKVLIITFEFIALIIVNEIFTYLWPSIAPRTLSSAQYSPGIRTSPNPNAWHCPDEESTRRFPVYVEDRTWRPNWKPCHPKSGCEGPDFWSRKPVNHQISH